MKDTSGDTHKLSKWVLSTISTQGARRTRVAQGTGEGHAQRASWLRVMATLSPPDRPNQHLLEKFFTTRSPSIRL